MLTESPYTTTGPLPPMNSDSDATDNPRAVATEFLEELAKGSFKPRPMDISRSDRHILTIGHEWDNRFLALRHIEEDNQVVQAIQSRSARLWGKTLGRLELYELSGGTSDKSHDYPELMQVTFLISWDGFQDGFITLCLGDHRVWGPARRWRVCQLSP